MSARWTLVRYAHTAEGPDSERVLLDFVMVAVGDQAFRAVKPRTVPPSVVAALRTLSGLTPATVTSWYPVSVSTLVGTAGGVSIMLARDPEASGMRMDDPVTAEAVLAAFGKGIGL